MHVDKIFAVSLHFDDVLHTFMLYNNSCPNKKRGKIACMKKQGFISLITVFIVIFILTFVTKLCMEGIIEHEFLLNSKDKFVALSIRDKDLEKPMSFTVFPWSKYKKKNICELTEEQKTFVQEKRLAECIVEMVNYDDILIQDKDNAVLELYGDIRKLTIEDGREYFVWYRTQVEGVCVFAMVSKEGEIFSFHYVTDIEYDYEEAMEYILENYENSRGVYEIGYELNSFETNRELFIEKICLKLKECGNLNLENYYQDVNLRKEPDKLNEENGSILMEYKSLTENSQSVYFYFDNQTKNFSGYHLEFY